MLLLLLCVLATSTTHTIKKKRERVCTRMLNLSIIVMIFVSSFCYGVKGLVVSRLLSSQIRIKTLKMSAASGGTREKLKERVLTTLKRQFGEEENFDPMVVPAKPEFGDYQCNAAMPLAKRLKMKPRDIAEKLMASLEVDDMIVSMDISGPGFINLKLSEDYLKKELLTKLGNSQRAGVATTNQPQRIVVDFSSPNIAKEMHVVRVRAASLSNMSFSILSEKSNLNICVAMFHLPAGAPPIVHYR